MRSDLDQLNKQIEQGRTLSWENRRQLLASTFEQEAEQDKLAALARWLQTAAPLQVQPEFTQQLERRLLVRNAELKLQSQQRSGHTWFASLFRSSSRQLSFSMALSLMVLLLMGTGILMAAQAASPGNPLYALKHWEQSVQVLISNSPASQINLELQESRDHLNELADLANPEHTSAYGQALLELDQQIGTESKGINALSTEPDHTQLMSKLVALKNDMRHTLRNFLPRLNLTEQVLTTRELGRLGDAVPELEDIQVILPGHPNEPATITIKGSGIQAGARLLLDGHEVTVRSITQNTASTYVFVINWMGNRPPEQIDILNPDNTAAQTTAITLKNVGGNGNNGNTAGKGSSATHSSGKGDNNHGPGRPTTTPTPHR